MHLRVNSFSEGTVGIVKDDKRRTPPRRFRIFMVTHRKKVRKVSFFESPCKPCAEWLCGDLLKLVFG